ncbi:cell number regulator 5-like isoform X3 [Triticum dicoccoides]|uniref:cell number regulator 5-like isoform X3 n=1 Tax=Triticum dicoccoides TaxID=85692 RepID=UPI0018900336|nr:cell number regulator 5-like isoform X3 [Triticum dicoccoides]
MLSCLFLPTCYCSRLCMSYRNYDMPSVQELTEMAGKGSYVPPQYVPLYGLDTEEDSVPEVEENIATRQGLSRDPTQWSSGICACFDDPQSCCIGATCPCFLFGKNAQFLGSGTLAGSCTTHCMLWGLLTSFCCLCTGGLVLAVPGSAVACYACGYRQALRTKYNLPMFLLCRKHHGEI